MKLNRRRFLKFGGLAAAGAGALVVAEETSGRLTLPASAGPFGRPAQVADPTPGAAGPVPALAFDSQRAAALAALNRAAFGPRPGELERVQAIGVNDWLDQQLAPECIDDGALDLRLAALPSLTLDIAELMDGYPRRPAAANPAGNSGGNPGPAQVVSELMTATLLRAVYSERQLFEVMVDFWSNHFNIYVRKGACVWLKTVDDREVIRKHALGKFGDLLLASSQSPAMLEYLDNRYNVKSAPNENYAREVMELHTLGVDGGYTQQDVQEVARCLTGWSLRLPPGLAARAAPAAGPAPEPGFFFNARQHDDGAKLVLGVQIAAGGGVQDGAQVLAMLAHHPSTAKFLAAKLARRFVADDPPHDLVQRVAATFTASGGDIRQTLGTLLHSPEFQGSYGQKVRRPFEFVAAALRGLGAETDGGRPLIAALALLGQAPFDWQSPNGYPDAGAAWLSSNGLLGRWKLALALATNSLPGTHVDLPAAAREAGVAATPEALVDFWAARLLGGPLPAAGRAGMIQLLKGAAAPDQARPLAARPLAARPGRDGELVAMLLSSPYFQWR